MSKQCPKKARAEVLKAYELDKLDGENCFDMLIEDLAERYAVDYPDKLMRDAEIIGVRAEYLKKVAQDIGCLSKNAS